MFFVEAKPGDEESARLIEQIVVLCEKRGLQSTHDDVVGSYVHLVVPVYDASDLQIAPLLWLETQQKMFHDVKRDEQGRLCLPASEANTTVKVGSVYPKPWIVVSDAVRHTLLAGGLAGLTFGEVCLRGMSIHASPRPFWEMKSSVVLPKMVNSVPRKSEFGPSYKVEDKYGEPHYAQEDLDRIGAFDVARTFEAMQTGEPWLIVSQRFYHYCLENKISLELRPARIDR